MAPHHKIAFFGGTFDPVHSGHLHLAALAQEKLALDQVHFLPCRISPHKSTTPPTRPEDRLQMLRLATSTLPWAVVDDFEINREGPSYSYLTAAAMHQRFPDAQLFWIMGGDQWNALPSWKHPERLAQHVEFIVLSRSAETQNHPDFTHHPVHGEHPASATLIRQSFAQGATSHPWLPHSVSDWIVQKKLYRS